MNAAATKSPILDKESARRKIRRMALEVAEQNTDEQEVVIAGIAGNGAVVAKNIASELQAISPLHVTLIQIHLDKKAPIEVTLDPVIDMKNKTIIIADDVANTGKTMFYALKPFLQTSPRKLQTLVLVERSHKLFPIQTDYAGLTIATTLQEHILVETEGGEIAGAWLY